MITGILCLVLGIGFLALGICSDLNWHWTAAPGILGLFGVVLIICGLFLVFDWEMARKKK